MSSSQPDILGQLNPVSNNFNPASALGLGVLAPFLFPNSRRDNLTTGGLDPSQQGTQESGRTANQLYASGDTIGGPPPPPAANNPKLAQAQLNDENMQKKFGYTSTMLTGGQGLLDRPTTTSQSLLGF